MSRKPLTEANANLAMLDYMLIKKTARDSQFVMSNDPFVVGIGLIIWLAAWQQVPAGSLPDDDRSLAGLAMFGRDIDGWKKVREAVLAGWVRCDDGRLYHPVMAEAVNTAWTGHRLSVYKRKAGTFNKRNERNPNNVHGVPTFKEWCDAGCPDDFNDMLGLERPKRGREAKAAVIVEPPEPPTIDDHDDEHHEDGQNSEQVVADVSITEGSVAIRKKSADEVREEQAQEVVNYYMVTLNHEGIKPVTIEGYVKRIKAYLMPSLGYTVEELKSIIDHADKDEWLSGAKGGKKYQGFETILGSKAKLDKYLTVINNNKGIAQDGTNNQRLNTQNQTVRATYIAAGCTISADGTVTSKNGSIVDELA